MSEIQIYVKTSALGEDGIHWRNVSKPNQPREIPPILNPEAPENCIVPRKTERFSTVEPLVIDTKPCILLVRHEGKLFLEITGIEATPERSNQLGRSIYDVIAWFADDNETNEEIFRKLAAKALIDFRSDNTDFLSTIKKSITFSGTDGFSVDKLSLSSLDKIEYELITKGQHEIWNQPCKLNSAVQVKQFSDRIVSNLFPQSNPTFVFIIEKEKECIQCQKKDLLDKVDPLEVESKNELGSIPQDAITSSIPTETVQSTNDSTIKKFRLPIIFMMGLLAGIILGIIFAVVLLDAKMPMINYLRQTATRDCLR